MGVRVVCTGTINIFIYRFQDHISLPLTPRAERSIIGIESGINWDMTMMVYGSSPPSSLL